MRNIFLICAFGVLIYSPLICAADEEKTYYFHMHPDGVGEKRLAVKYVVCQGKNDETVCLDPLNQSYFIPNSGTGSVKIPNKSGYAIIATSIEIDGKVIWGPYVANYAENGCYVDQRFNSLTFFLNKAEVKSITCVPGLG